MSFNHSLSAQYRRWGEPYSATWLLLSLMALLMASARMPKEASAGSEIILWFVLALLAEKLWCLARDGKLRHKASPFVHVATVLLLPLPIALMVNASSATLGTRLFRKQWRPHYPIFVTLATVTAGLTHRAFGPVMDAQVNILVDLSVWVLVGMVYHVVFQALITQCSYRRRDLTWFQGWRENYGHPTEFVAVAAMIVVSVMAALASRDLGVGGACLAVVPAYFVWDGWRRYLELERTQRILIDAERLSAKGEMAGEIGHELNNYLAAISGRAQLMAMDQTISDEVAEEIEHVRLSTVSMADLARRLMDMSQRGAKSQRFDIGSVIYQTLEMFVPQSRYAGVDLQVDAMASASVVMDVGQFQQILFTLLKRSVTYGPTGEPRRVGLKTSLLEGGTKVSIEVIRGGQDCDLEESHPQGLRLRGGDRELAGVRRMIERHGGLLVAQADESGRQGYRITLPLAAEA